MRPWGEGLTAHGGRGAVHGERGRHPLCPATAAAKPSRGRSPRAQGHLTRARGAMVAMFPTPPTLPMVPAPRGWGTLRLAARARPGKCPGAKNSCAHYYRVTTRTFSVHNVEPVEDPLEVGVRGGVGRADVPHDGKVVVGSPGRRDRRPYGRRAIYACERGHVSLVPFQDASVRVVSPAILLRPLCHPAR